MAEHVIPLLNTVTKTVITDKTIWRDVKYAALYVGKNRRQMGPLLRDGNVFPNARKHPQTGAWSIPDNDVKNARIVLENERRAKIDASFITGKRQRPTTASCNRIRRAVKNDATLTVTQRELFTTRIDAYEIVWDAKYAKRKPTTK